jgi:hypothetical protein
LREDLVQPLARLFATHAELPPQRFVSLRSVERSIERGIVADVGERS